jgi:hypothetical protein
VPPDIFPGTKKEPYPVDRGAIQVDGVALEFNINAAESENEFFKNINTVFNQMQEMVVAVNKDWEIKAIPVAHFKTNTWKHIPEDAKILGCDPDYNYTGMANPNPGEQLLNTPLRTGSGHIHIGWTEDEDVQDPLHFQDCRFIADKFRSCVGEFGFYQARTHEDYTRLQYYGMNGAFRPKPYGVELRSPSNRWLASEQTIRSVYRETKQYFDSITAGAK